MYRPTEFTMARNIKIALLLLAALATTAVAQNKFEVRKVDFEKIRQITLNSKAQFYYPRLLESYKGTDTTLNFEAYRDLYYGYIFQEDYNPFRKSEFSNKVEELYYKQPHSRAECDTIEKYAKLSLDDHIFDFDQMEFYIYVLKEKKKHALAAVKQFRLDRLIAAIMSSGKGTKDEPWVVILPDHEYYICGHGPQRAARRHRPHRRQEERRHHKRLLLRRVAHDGRSQPQIP